MKKFLLAALIGTLLFSIGCTAKPTEPTTLQQPAVSGSAISDYPAVLMVDGKIYRLTDQTVPIEDVQIAGTIDSYTDAYPEKNGENNFCREIPLSYADTPHGLAVEYESVWRLCIPEDTEAPPFDNVVPHENIGYCGNTVTVIRYSPPDAGESGWEKSIWGTDSIKLTDLLQYLDYREPVCKCLAEYEISTEFSDSPYEINLTEGYARHETGQIALTKEQLQEITAILENGVDNAKEP